MIKLNAYVNFQGNTEEAFLFYQSVFGGEFLGNVTRFKDVEGLPGKEHMSEADLNGIMHVCLPIGNDYLMGTDALEAFGQKLNMGNNFSISVHPDSREEADRIYNGLSAGGQAIMPMTDMFWGDYWGSLTDKFGLQWMVNYNKSQATENH